VAQLQQAEVLFGEGTTVVNTVEAIGLTVPTHDRWRMELGGVKLNQMKRQKESERKIPG
jgi:hypothetical protein